MSFPDAIKTCFRKYAVFKGRASRPEFWWFALLFYAVAFLGSSVLAAMEPDSSFDQASSDEVGVGTAVIAIVFVVVLLGLFLPYLAAGVRRLHDTGHSGWWWFIALLPTIGAIILIVILAGKGNQAGNEYGPVGVENSDPQGLRVAQHGSFILPTHRLRAETHRYPPRRCGARRNTTP
jgi:uncharacterized membrane protein YhaH (DUF805 family)